jgi:hypothetical protein
MFSFVTRKGRLHLSFFSLLLAIFLVFQLLFCTIIHVVVLHVTHEFYDSDCTKNCFLSFKEKEENLLQEASYDKNSQKKKRKLSKRISLLYISFHYWQSFP